MDSNLERPLPSLASLLQNQHLIKNIGNLDYLEATPVQAETIPAILNHKDLLVTAQTGSGKTAAFLLPALEKLLALPLDEAVIQMLVLAPTRELAQQIALVCQELAENTPLKIGLITGREDFKKQDNLLNKKPHVLIATPGRLLEHLQKDETYFDNLKILVLDEADRMLDMGFSPDVLAIAEQCNTERQTLLFSATLTAAVSRMSKNLLRNPETIKIHHFRTHQHQDIKQQILACDDKPHKQKLLLWLLTHEDYSKALIFTNTKLQAESVCAELRNTELKVNVLHGDMEQDERKRVMGLYRSGAINILVATDLAARGLDIEEIQLVINFDMARNANAYVHRIGRTGRAGAKGLAVSLISSSEWNLMTGIERYLNQSFERRVITELEGHYKGPKKLKKSGKAAGAKKKTPEKKTEKTKVKVRERDKKNIGKRRAPKNKPLSE